MSLNLDYEPKVLVNTKDLTNEEWLRFRTQGIGGSDVASVLGVSPYKTAFDTYHEKKCSKAEPDNRLWVTFEVGHRLESLVAEIFAKKTGYRVFKRDEMLYHALYPFMLADVDFFFETDTGKLGILECKTGGYNTKDKWDNDSLPYYYELQVRHYMAVANIDIGFVACLMGNTESDFVMRRVDRDLEFEEDMINEESAFWNDYVLNGIEPPFTEKGDLVLESIKRYKAYSANNNVYQINPEKREVMDRLISLKNKKSECDAESRKLENEIKMLYAPIINELKGSGKGICETPDCTYEVSYKPMYRTGVSKESLELMKVKDRDIYDRYVSVTESNRFSIKKRA